MPRFDRLVSNRPRRCQHGLMIIDGFVHQLPDTDPSETREWLDSLDAVVDAHGKTPPAS